MTRPEFEHIAAQLRQRVLNYCEHIDAERNVEALAVKVAKNCCVSMYRRQQRQANVVNIDQQTLKQQESSNSPQEQLEAKDTQRMLSEALDLLKPRERQLFEMRQIESLSVEEVSGQTGIPKTSVIAMVSAARKKVFTELTRRMKQ